MIRTLIVDDEHLVRKGLILTLPWGERGFQIVGEADNGEAALELMERTPVDLLMTDITMPAMDGFELMKRVKERYPSVLTVVLTCHQDFHFLQDAMRLGAVDYVVKTNLADEVLEDMLKRISDRMHANHELQRQPAAAAEAKQALVMLYSGPGEAGSAGFDTAAGAVALNGNGWLFANRSRSEVDALLAELAGPEMSGCAFFIRVTEWRTRAKASEWLAWLREKLFYDYQPADGAWTISLEELESAAANRKPAEPELESLRQTWTAMRWVFDPKEFQRVMDACRTIQPRSRILIELFERTAASWAMLAGMAETFRGSQDEVRSYRTLAEWERWFGVYCRELAAFAKGFACSGDVFVAILRAIDLLQTDLGEHASRADLAAMVNLSQGYFSTIFKEIVGRSFHDAAKEIRLEKAKRLLIEHADMPIYWIAEKTGFQDEKYFSKIFRIQTGMVPSEYREKHLR
ncbi:response regulator [Paenibacillus rhizovicinus]|uniref:Response regulator n=1 Tax=Paenibacillus rhizovicinus TaxID=2704463 RepID=A0A6C0NUS7_9BACL|nr:response regulator [Paenibacillus rhizovicinus]QHW29950.1 response regulator [Paenibacillus rhizovicinus]